MIVKSRESNDPPPIARSDDDDDDKLIKICSAVVDNLYFTT